MKKIITILALLAITTSAFTQITTTMPSQVENALTSSRSDATLDMFQSYSDTISASDIYTQEESFSSVWYDDYAVLSSGYRLSPTMYIGGIAMFDLQDAMNVTWGTSTTTTFSSPFDITLALGLEDMGFSYRIVRNTATDTYTSSTTTLTVLGNTTETETKDSTITANWQHILTYATKIGNDVDFSIPLVINHDLQLTSTESKSTTTGLADGSVDIKETTGTGGDVTIGIYPTFDIPVNKGIMNMLTLDAGLKFAVYNGVNLLDEKEITTTGGATTEDITTQKSNANYSDTYISVGVTPNLEWDLNDTFYFVAKPSVVLPLLIESDGKEQSVFDNGTETPATTDAEPVITTFEPKITLPIAAIIAPTDWLELRFGAQYELAWQLKNTDNATGSDTLDYGSKSTFELAAGFGFILAEDLLLDFAYTSFPADLAVNPWTNIVDGEVSLQVTYKY